MTYRGADLTAELRTLVETDAPACALDLDQALAHGLSARRRRRAAGLGGGVAGTCLVLTLILAFLTHSAPSAGRAVPAVTGTAAASRAKDPLTVVMTFGWLPAGLHLTGSTGDSITASDGTTQFDLQVMTLRSGQKPPNGCSSAVATGASAPASATGEAGVRITTVPCDQKAPDVNGHAAYWGIAPDETSRFDGYVELDWQYAPNQWAVLNGNVGKDASSDIVPTVVKVAEGLRFHPAQALPLPFHLPSLPAGLETMDILWQQAPAAARGPQARETWTGVDLSYSKPMSSPGDSTSSELDFFTAAATSSFPSAGATRFGTEYAPAKDVEHLTVDGHQALLIKTTVDGEPDQRLVVHDLDGVDFTLTAYNTGAIADVDQAGGILAYYASMKVLGADPAHWTTDVIG
ncbi:hypothetical protein KDL01_24690 [Actinospica durhamensis]|uniref:Uncharacterized protein n=1 Tax=Actinospica durhamensis TaxID=1508375 RepID=A0A941EWX4_9ACTN|nr:hypothetical protein [Actinospica durhamensis]MBR7836499.1 hypothetical protein [Actinospica durhamensis]